MNRNSRKMRKPMQKKWKMNKERAKEKTDAKVSYGSRGKNPWIHQTTNKFPKLCTTTWVGNKRKQDEFKWRIWAESCRLWDIRIQILDLNTWFESLMTICVACFLQWHNEKTLIFSSFVANSFFSPAYLHKLHENRCQRKW